MKSTSVASAGQQQAPHPGRAALQVPHRATSPMCHLKHTKEMPRPESQTGEAAERLQESQSRCLWDPKVFPLKFTEIFLSKHSAFGLLLFCLLWRLIFGLPASVLSKNLQTIQKWKKQQLLLFTPTHKTGIFKLTCSTPAVLQEPCYFPECLQRKVRGKPLMLTEAGHWDNSRYQLVIGSQI